MQKLIWNYEVQTDPLISSRRPDLVIVKKKKKKKNWPNCWFAYCSDRAQSKIEKKKSKDEDKNRGLAKELKNLWNMKMTVIKCVIGTVIKWLVKGLAD